MLTSMNGQDDLAQLRGEFPAWRFGTVWTTVATGPDVRRVWARKDDVFLSDWNAAGLRVAISAEQRRSGGAA
jgi:hypothetical protein